MVKFFRKPGPPMKGTRVVSESDIASAAAAGEDGHLVVVGREKRRRESVHQMRIGLQRALRRRRRRRRRW